MAQVIGFQIQIDGLGKTVETATELKRAIADVNAELKKTTDVQEIKKLEAKLVDLKAAQMEVNKVVKEQIKVRNEEITATDKANGAYRKLSKELNDQRNRYKDLAAAEQESSQEAKDLLVSINNLDKKLKGIDATVGQFQRNVGGYTEALGQFFPKLGGTIGNVTGLVGDLSSGFANLKGVTGGIPKGLGTIGIALTAFQGISSIFSDLAESANELKAASNTISNFVQVSETELTSLAVKTQTIAQTYGKDLNEISLAANTVSKELNVSFSEALDNIEIGFRKGADANNEFLDNLKEYPAQFAAAGLSIKEYLAVAIAATNQGIFSDKGLDVVKEFGLRIREQTKTTKDALIDAFGETFSNSIFNSLNDGSISTAEALERITVQMSKTEVSGSKLQTVIADVFGAAGEDAGLKFILSLKDVIKNSSEVDKNLTKQQESSDELYKTNLQLAESQAKANLAIADTSKSLSLATKQVRIYFNEVIAGVFAANDEIDKAAPKLGSVASMSFGSTTLASIESNIKQSEKFVKKVEDERKKKENEAAAAEQKRKDSNKKAQEDFKKAQLERIALLKTEGGIEAELSKLQDKRKTLAFDSKQFKQIDIDIKKLEKDLEKFNPTTAGSKGGEKFVQGFTEGSIAALENRRSELQTSFSNAVVGSDTQKEIAVKLNEVNAQIKTAVETQNEILGLNAEKKKQNAIDEINQNFKIAQSVIELERIKSDLSLSEIEDIKEKRFILNDDYNAEIQRIDALIALEEAGSKQMENLLVERRAVEVNYIKGKEGIEKQEEQINNNRLAAIKKFNKLIAQGDIDAIKDETERRIAAAKQKLADDLENLENDKDFILLSELEKAKLRKLLIGKTEDEIQELIDKKAEIELDKRKENAQKLIDGIADSIMSVTDIIATFQQARAEKEAEAINEQITNTENNITELEAKAEKASGIRKKRIERDIAAQKELLKQQQAEAEAIRIKAAKEEKRIAIIQAIIQGALAFQRALAQGSFLLAIPTGIAAAAQIATIAAQPLAEGGVVTGQRVNQKQNIPTRSNGDNVLAYVKRGEVVLNQRQQSLLGGSPTFRKLGIKGFAEGGMVPPINPPIQGLGLQGNMNEFLQVMEAKTDAINNRIDRLQAYVVSEDIARDLAEGNKLKINATL
jgi:hypothetical protein